MLAATALGAAGAAALSGCGQITPWATPPRPAPDVWVLAGVIAAEHALVARYQSVIAGFPALGPVITPLLREHEEHLAALRGRLAVPAGSPYHLSTGSPGASPSPSGHVATVAGAFAYLRAAERDQAADLVRRLTAVKPSLAQLMASIGASEASHESVLRSAARRHQGAAAT